ncbi:Coenzyme F420 hydrogenase/dehydrogenase, beta subunit C-terminal domain [uncultured Treponema sp.]|uniref:Coenzyme F420 hydrogenase/dehydrogenase, beta subunit C-terminal domain n=1 Tax=uncultured Treponema sp. TaxID=162155 RepID=UPI0027D9C9D4|nr:Coenzyme F420 hydrogenase/dehydrogenase, beta subunit C-terminal domain [uncultured Treponema sp.]
MKNVSEIKENECCGCNVCVQVCPKKCIELKANREGFLYPIVDSTECISCLKCIQNCTVLKKFEDIQFQQKGFAVRLKDKSKLMQSSSGGVFSGIAESIINEGGIVFGATYDDELNVHHIMVDNLNDLNKLKGSKYVAGNTEKTYSEVKNILDNSERKVLYSGSPCQIAGLKSFLHRDYDNLYTADIICHGMPSSKLFHKYLEWLGKKNKGKILYYGFRDKDVGGWTCGGKAKTKTKTKTKTINGPLDPYYSSFLRGATYRQSCYSCKFSNYKKRQADITMGDFWGIEFYYPKFYSKYGTSCCLINSSKGEKLFSETENQFECQEVKIEEIISENHNLLHPTPKPKKRNLIYRRIDDEPKKLIKDLYSPIYIRIIRLIISLIPHDFKYFLKKIVRKLK